VSQGAAHWCRKALSHREYGSGDYPFKVEGAWSSRGMSMSDRSAGHYTSDRHGCKGWRIPLRTRTCVARAATFPLGAAAVVMHKAAWLGRDPPPELIDRARVATPNTRR
jgi:hypothetical protein